jgi:predicted esterase YcpF (UPF0227 family)
MILYIHGFNSSALSFKAGLLRKRMAELRRGREYLCPELPHEPQLAMSLLERIVLQHAGRVALIGSSLGGFYATWLAERYGVRAVLVNPAVRPYQLLERSLGLQTNLYTGAQYELTRAHLDALRTFEVDSITPERYLLMACTGDEVLDYREAVGRYGGAEQLVIEGGDHGFSDFASYVDTALAFCRSLPG